ncbi:MAG: hypothetical protein US26_C0011G0005 [Candidatus Nomurabacteria bacterium GW2011_GWE1_36_71]|nr:MAG: hypothetical protein US26_C0011G0005 [Candidatus Nomurabacteria bacterium GW2011_GWE1_36_71]
MTRNEIDEISNKAKRASELFEAERHIELANFSDLVRHIAEDNSLTKAVAEINRTIEKTTKIMVEPLVSLTEMSNRITETYKKTIEPINLMSEQLRKMAAAFSFEPMLEKLREFSKEYDIAEEGAIKCMQKYKWFITANMPPSLIFEVYQLSLKKGNMTKEVNKVFEDFLFSNNYEGLDELLLEWKQWIDPDRYKIIKDTFSVIKSAPKRVNITNVVLPTLIVQAEGILKDKTNFWNLKNEKGYKKLKTSYKNNSSKILPQDLQNLIDDIVIDYLFQDSRTGVPLKNPFQFNRHKIIHGEVKKYGRKNYLVRIILLIDCFATLK